MDLESLKTQTKVMKQELISLLCEKSVQISKEDIFTLASGKKSNFYINCKTTSLDPYGMFLIGNLIFEKLKDSPVKGIGGLTFGADPLAMATAFASVLAGKPIQAFSIRKEQKDHGLIRWLEGGIKEGEKVAIIDDVATTGGSTIKAIQRARESGLDVCKVIILVDREEGGLENIAEYTSDVSAILLRSELMAFFENQPV